MQSKNVVILGAGPAGLACAFRLLKKTSFNVYVLDISSKPGGFCQSIKWKDHILDLGPHTFHCRGGEPQEIMESLYKEDKENLFRGTKNVFVYLKGHFFKYPLQLHDILLKFNIFLSLRILVEFFVTSFFHTFIGCSVDSFEIWGKKRFGPKLYKLGFGDYSEKVWKTKAENISVKFASQKIQGFSFINLIKKILKIGGEVTEPYFQNWLYPKSGSVDFYYRLANEVEAMGGKVYLNIVRLSVTHSDRLYRKCSFLLDGREIELKTDYLVSTIPLSGFVNSVCPEPPLMVHYSGSKLSYLALILVFLEFDEAHLFDYQWFYLLEKCFDFNRICNQKNISTDTIKNGKTVLALELTCNVDDEYWSMKDEELIELAKSNLKRIKHLNLSESVDGMVLKVPNAYEVYRKDFEKNMDVLFHYFQNFENLFFTGRRSLFLQGDQHNSIEMGLGMADLIACEKNQMKPLKAFYNKYINYLT